MCLLCYFVPGSRQWFRVIGYQVVGQLFGFCCPEGCSHFRINQLVLHGSDFPSALCLLCLNLDAAGHSLVFHFRLELLRKVLLFVPFQYFVCVCFFLFIISDLRCLKKYLRFLLFLVHLRLLSIWNCLLMFFTAFAMKMLRCSIVSAWKRVTATIFFRSWVEPKKNRGCARLLYQTTATRATSIPVPLTRPGLLLSIPNERWNRVLFTYGSPTLTLACHPWTRWLPKRKASFLEQRLLVDIRNPKLPRPKSSLHLMRCSCSLVALSIEMRNIQLWLSPVQLFLTLSYFKQLLLSQYIKKSSL